MHALNYLFSVLFSLQRETRGAVASEYAFLIVFIAIVSAAGMLTLGEGLTSYFGAMGNALGNAASQS
jgi:Flp pilus assembly pilin Flp